MTTRVQASSICNYLSQGDSKMTTRLRHRPQAEEEDAAALKLGPGMRSMSMGVESRLATMQNSIMLVVFLFPRSSICSRTETRTRQTPRTYSMTVILYICGKHTEF